MVERWGQSRFKESYDEVSARLPVQLGTQRKMVERGMKTHVHHAGNQQRSEREHQANEGSQGNY